MIFENLRMAFASLRAAKLRSFLTMLGIIIGVAAVVAITAIGQGVKDSVTKQVSGLGANTLTIITGDSSSKRGGGFGGSFGVTSTLTTADVTSLEKVDGVVAASPVGLLVGTVSKGSATSSGASINATAPTYASITNRTISTGRYFTDAESTSNVAVIGSVTKTDLFGDADALGQMIDIRGIQFKVIGVLDHTPSLFGSDAQNILVDIPFGAAGKINGAPLSVTEISVEVKDAKNIDPTVDRIKATLKQDHKGQTDFTVYTQSDLLSTFNSILSLLTTFIAAIAAISLLVGGIGIMNIMLVNVTERTREIGLRKAIGASNGSVLSQFMIEALVISILGGGLGILVAVGMATAAGKLAKITPSFTPGSIILAVGVSAGIGVIFGIAPAFKASRLRPIQALKSE